MKDCETTVSKQLVGTEQEASTFCHPSLLKKYKFQGGSWQLEIFLGKKVISVAVYELINLKTDKKESVSKKKIKLRALLQTQLFKLPLRYSLFQYSL